jgi:phenylacetate-coenzyme A ligase PaaK-like adenylate-forming protein
MLSPVIPESFRARPYARQHFEDIARWAAKHHPFYSKRVSGDTPEFPVITRRDVLEDNELLLNGAPETARTSGSTAVPVRVSWSPQRSLMEREDNREYTRWLGGQLPDIRILQPYSNAAGDRALDVMSPLPEQVDFILRRHREAGGCALVTYPSNLENLLRHALDEGIDLSFIRRLVCLGEVYEPWLDELAAKVLPNATRSVTYSSVEAGLMAASCPHRPGNYHIMSHKLGIEILDEDGRPCREGEAGQVVVTDYFNRVSPFLRYAVGDIATPVACDCGRIQLPAMTRIVGKVRGTLKDHAGRPVLFSGMATMFRDSPEIRQFQVLQSATDRLLVRYVPRADVPLEPFFERVRARFAQDLGGQPQVEFEAFEDIPRSAGGRFHGCLCQC